jgi:hypothetical protein
MVKKFTILGERCSGTNFLQAAIERNFDIEVTWQYGWKHFFGFNKYEDSDDVLFIGIVRDPYNWLNSLFNMPHHLANSLRNNPDNFLTEEFYSYYDEIKNGVKSVNYGNEIMEDRNIYSGSRYKNIFEMRKVKCQFLLDDMPNRVKNYILIRYEDLVDQYDQTLDLLKNKFSLKNKHDQYVKVEEYKGLRGCNYKTVVKKYHLDKGKIRDGLDVETEKRLGYVPGHDFKQ